MNRRSLLAALPAAAVAGATPSLAEAETPVMRLFREWHDFSSWVNGPATKGISDEEMSRLTDVLNECVARVLSAQSQSHLDTIIKFYVVVEEHQIFFGLEEFEPLEAEARALVGV